MVTAVSKTAIVMNDRINVITFRFLSRRCEFIKRPNVSLICCSTFALLFLTAWCQYCEKRHGLGCHSLPLGDIRRLPGNHPVQQLFG